MAISCWGLAQSSPAILPFLESTSAMCWVYFYLTFVSQLSSQGPLRQPVGPPRTVLSTVTTAVQGLQLKSFGAFALEPLAVDGIGPSNICMQHICPTTKLGPLPLKEVNFLSREIHNQVGSSVDETSILTATSYCFLHCIGGWTSNQWSGTYWWEVLANFCGVHKNDSLPMYTILNI